MRLAQVYNEESRLTADDHGLPWDINNLLELFEEAGKEKTLEVAAKVRRTYRAVQSKAYRTKLSLAVKGGVPIVSKRKRYTLWQQAEAITEFQTRRAAGEDVALLADKSGYSIVPAEYSKAPEKFTKKFTTPPAAGEHFPKISICTKTVNYGN